MAKTKHGLQETVGIYQARGVVSGVDKEKFYVEKKTRTKKNMRMTNFGLEVAPNKNMYISLNGMERDLVYFSSRDSEGKTTVEKVDWAKRKSFDKEGYNLIGVRVGLEKDEDGKNITSSFVEYDACEEIKNHLKDGNSIFTQGKLEFSSFKTDKGDIKRSIKFVPNRIFNASDINFADEDFEQEANFSQQIVFVSIEKRDEAFVVSAKIVNYNSIEDAEFYIYDKKLADIFRKNLKPYNAIKVSGKIEIIENVETVEDDDTWGEEDPTQRKNAPTERRFVITGASGKTVDTETYTEKLIGEAIKKLTQSENAQEDWGETDTVEDVDDEEW